MDRSGEGSVVWGFGEGAYHACAARRKNVQYVQGNSNEPPDKGTCRNAWMIFHSCQERVPDCMTQLDGPVRAVLYFACVLFICEPDRVDRGLEKKNTRKSYITTSEPVWKTQTLVREGWKCARGKHCPACRVSGVIRKYLLGAEVDKALTSVLFYYCQLMLESQNRRIDDLMERIRLQQEKLDKQNVRIRTLQSQVRTAVYSLQINIPALQ